MNADLVDRVRRRVAGSGSGKWTMKFIRRENARSRLPRRVVARIVMPSNFSMRWSRAMSLSALGAKCSGAAPPGC